LAEIGKVTATDRCIVCIEAVHNAGLVLEHGHDTRIVFDTLFDAADTSELGLEDFARKLKAGSDGEALTNEIGRIETVVVGGAETAVQYLPGTA